MTTDYRAILAELVSALADFTPFSNREEAALASARAALAEPQPPAAHLFPTPHQIAECGGPCEQGGPAACDCGLYKRSGQPQLPAGEVAELVAALKIIDKMQREWVLLGNDDGTASPSLTMPISLRRFTVIRDALTRAADLLERLAQDHLPDTTKMVEPIPVSERLPEGHKP